MAVPSTRRTVVQATPEQQALGQAAWAWVEAHRYFHPAYEFFTHQVPDLPTWVAGDQPAADGLLAEFHRRAGVGDWPPGVEQCDAAELAQLAAWVAEADGVLADLRQRIASARQP